MIGALYQEKRAFIISIYKNIRAKTFKIVCAANRQLGVTSYFGLLALSKHGLSFSRTTKTPFLLYLELPYSLLI